MLADIWNQVIESLIKTVMAPKTDSVLPFTRRFLVLEVKRSKVLFKLS